MLSHIFDWMRTGGLPLLFFLVLLEGNPLTGPFVPGQVLVIFAGFLISTTGMYNLYIALIFVFVAAFLGDMAGYYMGRKYGVSGLKLVGLKDDSKVFKSSYVFFEKYGPWSLVVGRQVNFVNSFMPFFAGCFGLGFFKFVVFAALGCFLWATLSIALGYYFGFIIVENFKFVLEFVLFLVLYFVFVFFVYRNVKNVYFDKFSVIRAYTLHNVIFFGFLSVVVVFMGYLSKWGYHDLVNDSLAFLYIPGFYIVWGFLVDKLFLIGFALAVFLILFALREFRMLTVYVWSMVFFVFMNLMIGVFMKVWYGVVLYHSMVFLTFLFFFVWILFKSFCRNRGILKVINVVVVCVILISIFSVFSFTGDVFLTILSFLVGVVLSELMLVLSHYQILDSCLSECRYKGNRD
jgi:membrane-associated protein